MSEHVDVVIPTYNTLRFLPEAVESVLAQTHADLTLYVVDDGSTDGTENYVRSIADPRVRYLRKANGGQASARNHGIRASSSPYVALLDADDVWYPHKLEAQLELMQSRPDVGLVYGHEDKIDEHGAIVGHVEARVRGRAFDELIEGNFISGSGSMVLVRREVFDRVGLFHEDFLIGEDWAMWLRIARNYAIDFVPEPLAGLRLREDSLQRRHRMMADGFVYMWPIVLDDLELRGRQRAHLTRSLLGRGAGDYAAAGMYRRSLATLLQLWRTSPRSLLDVRNARFAIGVACRAVRDRADSVSGR